MTGGWPFFRHLPSDFQSHSLHRSRGRFRWRICEGVQARLVQPLYPVRLRSICNSHLGQSCFPEDDRRILTGQPDAPPGCRCHLLNTRIGLRRRHRLAEATSAPEMPCSVGPRPGATAWSTFCVAAREFDFRRAGGLSNSGALIRAITGSTRLAVRDDPDGDGSWRRSGPAQEAGLIAPRQHLPRFLASRARSARRARR